MKIITAKIVTAVGLASLLAGCTSPNGQPDYTGSGALIGGASGAAIGAMADRRAPGAGALIGGAAGLIAGGLIGHSMDQQQARYQGPPPVVYYTQPAQPPPSINDIKAMSKAGLSDGTIIGQISNTHAVYHLDANALIDLKNAGVSQTVIAYMVNTASPVVAQAPPPAPQTQAVVVAPGPDYVWVDGEWVWNGGAWIWIGGRWALPPYPHAIWVGARWERGPHGWYRLGGHWR
jgi:hypothetical protein